MIVFHNMRSAPEVASEPNVRPGAWLIIRTEAGSNHLVAALQNGSLRLTSALMEIHVSARIAVTASGRVYELDEAPADDAETVSLLMARAQLDLQGSCEDVSVKVWSELLRLAH